MVSYSIYIFKKKKKERKILALPVPPACKNVALRRGGGSSRRECLGGGWPAPGEAKGSPEPSLLEQLPSQALKMGTERGVMGREGEK